MSDAPSDDGRTIDGEHPQPPQRMPDEPDDQQDDTATDESSPEGRSPLA